MFSLYQKTQKQVRVAYHNCFTIEKVTITITLKFARVLYQTTIISNIAVLMFIAKFYIYLNKVFCTLLYHLSYFYCFSNYKNILHRQKCGGNAMQ